MLLILLAHDRARQTLWLRRRRIEDLTEGVSDGVEDFGSGSPRRRARWGAERPVEEVFHAGVREVSLVPRALRSDPALLLKVGQPRVESRVRHRAFSLLDQPKR
jgi:hypothetical protein